MNGREEPAVLEVNLQPRTFAGWVFAQWVVMAAYTLFAVSAILGDTKKRYGAAGVAALVVITALWWVVLPYYWWWR